MGLMGGIIIIDFLLLPEAVKVSNLAQRSH